MTSGTERSNEAFVEAALAGSRFRHVQWVTETGSTNADLVERAQNGAPEQVLITDLQTAGRGRRDREWHAPAESGILMSLLIRGVAPSDGFWVMGAVALAASEMIAPFVDTPCTLKWPNDVMLGGPTTQKKVAGVLAHRVDDAAIVGIGINVRWPDQMPDAATERGTAINWHKGNGTPPERPALAASIVQRASQHLSSDADLLHASWVERCSTIGQRVRVDLAAGSIVGNAVGIDADGALQIEENGRRSTHQVGDVVHLRPTI